MPEPLTKTEVNSSLDPAVAKQYDDTATAEEKFTDFYAIADRIGVGMLCTQREGVGPVARCMAPAKRSGPDFLFLSNKHSRKFRDLDANKTVQLSFHDSGGQEWISVTGSADTVSDSDSRIKEVYSKGMAAWFGDLGDGVHDGGPEDPRMALIEVRAKYVVYYKRTAGMLGAVKEIGGAVLTGRVAQTGLLREMGEEEIGGAREKDSGLSGN